MSIQEFLFDIGSFINFTLIPFLFALALFVFIFNVARYFILGAHEETKRAHARTLALYGIGAFVFLVSIWGIVNLLVSSLNIGDDRSFCPDYMGDWCLDSGRSSSSGNGWFFEFEFTSSGSNNEGTFLPETAPAPTPRPEPYSEPFRGPR
ncbi:MAG: hypothetical protein WDZ93_00670 [Candidatus Paceibacterota bacterium]